MATAAPLNYLKKDNVKFKWSEKENTAFNALNVSINNSIIYGEGGFVDDEVVITKLKQGTGFTANFYNVLYKQKNANASLIFTNSLLNQNPVFDSINYDKRIFDFHLKNNSPCIDKANTTQILNYDLDKMQKML